MAIILLVEDKPEEIAIAKQALTAAGHKVAVATYLEDALRIMKTLGERLGGIATDLHFPQSAERAEQTSGQPCGLAVIAEAVRRGIPVAVCSDVDHHYAQYAKVVIEVLAKSHPVGVIPFVMDTKDWARAIAELTPLLK